MWIWQTMKMSKNGFTLIEMLLSFMIFLVIVFSLPLLLKVFDIWTIPKNDFSQLEWQIFTQQSKLEIRESAEIHVDDHQLRFTKFTGEIVTYELYNNKLRRQVNGRGHEILLQNIKSVRFKPKNNGVMIICFDKDNRQYSSLVASLIEIVVRSG